MNGFRQKYPPLFVLAWLALFSGLTGSGGALLFQPEASILKPLLLVSMGLVAFGAGEILNHPLEQIKTTTPPHTDYELQAYRRRNDCSLGNLLDIGALLLIFIGIARFMYPH